MTTRRRPRMTTAGRPAANGKQAPRSLDELRLMLAAGPVTLTELMGWAPDIPGEWRLAWLDEDGRPCEVGVGRLAVVAACEEVRA